MEKIKICALDIDGVLCEYPKAWVDYINAHYPNQSKNNDLNELKEIIPYNAYKNLKEKYRISGIKRTLPIIEGSVSLTKRLRKAGYLIVLLTKRPFYRHKEILRDTLYWLRSNGFEYDLIFHGKDKHIQILKYLPEVEFIAEDNHSIANEIAKLGYKVYLLDNEYNRQRTEKKVIRIKKLDEIKIR